MRVIEGLRVFGLEYSKAHSKSKSPIPRIKDQAAIKTRFMPLLRTKCAFFKPMKRALHHQVGEDRVSGPELDDVSSLFSPAQASGDSGSSSSVVVGTKLVVERGLQLPLVDLPEVGTR